MKQIVSWDASLNTEDSNVQFKELALAHLREVTYPEVDAADDALDDMRELFGKEATVLTYEEEIVGFIRRCLADDDYRRICDLDLDYQRISSPLNAYHLRQCLAFFQKRADLDLGVDRAAVAMAKFEEAEALCSQTNHIFRKWSAGEFQFHPRVESILHAAQRKIATVLGDVPSLESLKPRFGPGATTKVKKSKANPRMKLSAGLQCSYDLLPVVDQVLAEMPSWVEAMETHSRSEADEEWATVDVEPCHGKLAFVPKNAKTDRSIGVEPALNTMFQLAVGDYIGERLAAFGVDLTDQSRNQRLARYGSFTGELATLDLSSASDTIATELVAHLLPLDWVLTLERLRTSTYEHKGKVIRLQKFSSMGNGFTFPLETLIFWALASSTTEVYEKTDFLCTAYGDDIIVPVAAYGPLCEVLHAVGFIPNRQKSFATGPFRESCGKDYFRGIDIRPCYIKGPLSGENMYTLHNYYVRTLQPDFALRVLASIHPVLRNWGPDGYGDGHLIGDWEASPVRRNGYGGYTFETYTWKPKRDFKLSLPGDRVLPLYTIYSRSPDGLQQDGYTLSYDSSPGHLKRELKCAIQSALAQQSDGQKFTYDRRGRLGCTLPGRSECKLIKIYTFSSR